MDRMIIIVLVLALAYFCFDKFILTPRRDAALVAATKSRLRHGHHRIRGQSQICRGTGVRQSQRR